MARQPYLQRLQANSISILWTTSEPGSGSVTVTGPMGSTSIPAAMQAFEPADTGMAAPYYQFQADFSGLQAGTSYYYQVEVDGAALALGPQYTFTTPTTGPFSFLAFGDSGADSPQQIALIQQMMAEPGISKVLHLGDLAYESGTFAEFDANYFALNAPLMSRLPFFATPGNHEYLTDNAAAFVAGHVMPPSNVPTPDVGRYYSFDWGDAHFTSIDSNLLQSPSTTRMLAWLDNDLATTGKYWKIVFFHHPPYPTGTHLTDPLCALAQQNVIPILERHGVQLVLNGHEHGYERSWPLAGGQRVTSGPSTMYVISGGGGGEQEFVGSRPETAIALAVNNYLRVDVDNNQLTFSAIGLGGNVIEKITLTPPPVIAPNSVLSIGDFTPAIAAGSLASVFGQNLAVRPVSSSGFPLPAQLGEVSVTANGNQVPLLYAAPTQINIQIPYEVAGQVSLQITTPNGTSTSTLQVVPVAPSIIAITSGSAIASASNPAAQGSYVTVYATGLGAPVSAVATGRAAPEVANSMAAPIQVWLGNTELTPSYAGLAPGFAGLSQINFAIPSGMASGAYPLRIASGSASSLPQNLIIGSPAPVTSSGDSVRSAPIAGEAVRSAPIAANSLAGMIGTPPVMYVGRH